jgi:prolyl-tRNA editing enzyme YbaK/EbsC (Cys-tRNA(Pro) deacylase)
VSQIAKSIVFSAEKGPVLVIASGNHRISVDKLKALLNEDVKMMDANTVKNVTGFAIGGVPPIGHVTPMRILIDEDLLAHDFVWTAAGTPHAVFRTTPQELLRMTRGQVADVKEGSPSERPRTGP